MIVLDDSDTTFNTNGWTTVTTYPSFRGTSVYTFESGVPCWWDTGPIEAGTYAIYWRASNPIGNPDLLLEVLDGSTIIASVNPLATTAVGTLTVEGTDFPLIFDSVHLPSTGVRVRATGGPDNPGGNTSTCDACLLVLIAADAVTTVASPARFVPRRLR